MNTASVLTISAAIAVIMKEKRQTRFQWLINHAEHSGDECLMWPFPLGHKGYGQLGLSGKVVSAHRMMCQLAHGAAPSPQHQAAHSCGNGFNGCVNPRHLSWKTPQENAADRKSHGRAGPGLGPYRFVRHEVEYIRKLKGKRTAIELAAQYNVSSRSIENIWGGRTYAGPHFRQRRTHLGKQQE